ncbi:hypothetical protein FSP39_004347 [Pinctada imbricata]|uniref:G-protein coupled receptors family 1 profile domain-containing protein n=1 Tax=Pinctada imbricata TaxID=66713 RepID=A0AA88Y2L4_PINIB|nr:hypothetical protein FSP39_004347 [Pinctada imbricata]
MAAEAIWQTTVQWLAGNSVCKLVRFIQGFGFLLSTYVTVVISLDRCCVILDPMSRNKAPQRVRVMVAVSWFLSALFSIPQALVFSVQRGPFEVDFYQCISTVGGIYNKMYNIFCLLMQFMLPLSIMIIAYGLILCTISRKSKEFRDTESTSNSSEVARGQVKNTLLHKAKKKALRMSVFIVLAFIVCWFPYYVIFTGKSFGYWNIIDPNLMKGLSMMGLTNSIINPIIYGAFQLCKVNKTRSWKKGELRNTYDKVPSMRRPTSNRHHKCLSTKDTKNTYLIWRRNTLVVCRCDQFEIPKARSASLQCVVVMCQSDQET